MRWSIHPKKQRHRFPENCIQIKNSAEKTIADADSANKQHAALVHGPSRSSEGLKLYYLIEWLE
ncbi:MAG: hypothetical protein V3U62_04365 [Sedimenticolaceae bacterium]